MENTIEEPQLELIKQTAVVEEKVSKNGCTKKVHFVVKNSPFELLIGLRNAKTANFHHLAFDVKLIYDVTDEREVNFVKVMPIEYKPLVSDVGDQIRFNVKMKVLSSQHENNLFKLKIHVWDPLNLHFPQLQLLSEPIRVVAKCPPPRRRTRIFGTTGSSNQESGSSCSSDNAFPTPAKRSYNEAFLMDMLEAIERGQVEQGQLLKSIFGSRDVIPTNPEVSFAVLEETGGPDPKRRKVVTDEKDFGSLFSDTLESYAAMSLEEKTEYCRKMAQSSKDVKVLVEMIDTLNVVGLQREASKSIYSSTESNPGLNQPDTLNGFCMNDSQFYVLND